MPLLRFQNLLIMSAGREAWKANLPRVFLNLGTYLRSVNLVGSFRVVAVRYILYTSFHEKNSNEPREKGKKKMEGKSVWAGLFDRFR